jgi:carbon monoxide dehydrogenase subunit G
MRCSTRGFGCVKAGIAGLFHFQEVDSAENGMTVSTAGRRLRLPAIEGSVFTASVQVTAGQIEEPASRLSTLRICSRQIILK